MTNPKQVIVMRTDLGMRKGKMCAQAAHASMAVILDMMEVEYKPEYEERVLIIPANSDLDKWLNGPFKKICVGVNSESELENLFKQSTDSGLPVAKIIDNGLTEFGGNPTFTCIAIGPASSEKIDKITAHLKLL